MRPATSMMIVAAAIAVAAACADAPTGNGSTPLGTWGSSTASLVVSDTGANLKILAFGSCFGSYGAVSLPISTPLFDRPGSYTQLTGFYPGHVDYPAEFSGVVSGSQMSITVSVAALGQTFGPFSLTRGVGNAWTPCLYP